MVMNDFFTNKLIVGLGNPGKKYHNSRHNIGFYTLDTILTQESPIWLGKKDLRSEIYKLNNTLFAKPQTYMNASGEAVSKLMQFYKFDISQLVIIHDDADLEVGRIKFAKNSSSAGHHGIESIARMLGSLDFVRLRIGIGRPENSKFDLHDYVLSDFTQEELKLISKNFESFLKTL
jgi:PTH1 family peptidyl-tRNA hydrolase